MPFTHNSSAVDPLQPTHSEHFTSGSSSAPVAEIPAVPPNHRKRVNGCGKSAY
jgi:hypothetical protein